MSPQRGLLPLALLCHFCSCYTWENHNWEGTVDQSGEDANKNAWLYQVCTLLCLSVLLRRICKLLVGFILCLLKVTYLQR